MSSNRSSLRLLSVLSIPGTGGLLNANWTHYNSNTLQTNAHLGIGPGARSNFMRLGALLQLPEGRSLYGDLSFNGATGFGLQGQSGSFYSYSLCLFPPISLFCYSLLFFGGGRKKKENYRQILRFVIAWKYIAENKARNLSICIVLPSSSWVGRKQAAILLFVLNDLNSRSIRT